MSRRAPARVAVCAPDGDMRPWPERFGRCSCGAVVHLVRAAPGVNDWAEEALDGKRAVDRAPSMLRTDPAGWWARLAEHDVARYSALRAAIDLGHWTWWHHHRAVEWGPNSDPTRVPPFCCGSPMWASPDGWKCRRGNALVAYA